MFEFLCNIFELCCIYIPSNAPLLNESIDDNTIVIEPPQYITITN
jgi:hypothetical protein